MIRFIDGPAAGETLLLKRAPMFLRVVQDPTGKWDALDQPGDTPKPDERIHAYVIKGRAGVCHINKRGPGSGFYASAEYRFVTNQPVEPVMRNTARWRGWAFIERDRMEGKS